MGETQIPSHYLYGASTQRAAENYSVSPFRFCREFIRVLALLKVSCAEVNRNLGRLDAILADAIIKAGYLIADGAYDDHFVVDIFQTGSGTSTNMNFNEVAANIANMELGSPAGSKDPVHPNDHVNLGQSSNDIIPTTMHATAATAIAENLIPALGSLRDALYSKTEQFGSIIKTARTHLQDATPMFLGQEFSGYTAQVVKGIQRLENTLPSLRELAIGGTAVGTGMNTHTEFGSRVCFALSEKLGMTFREAQNHFEAQAGKDSYVEASGILRVIAVSLSKIANDIRWLASGPRAGLAEIRLPDVQPGSSSMPGKANPVIPESVLQVCAHVMGNDATVALAGLSGNFELNVMMPVMTHNLLESIRFLSNAARMFETKCIRGIEANSEHLENTVERGLMLATALMPVVGYDKATEIAQNAFKENKTIREIAAAATSLSEVELKKILDPGKMVHLT